MWRIYTSLRLLLFGLAGMMGMCVAATSPAEEMTLEELIELVRQNELLYADIDVSALFLIEAPNQPGGTIDMNGAALKFVQRSQTRERYVAQGELYSSERTSETQFTADERGSHRAIYQYDGQVTRSLNGRTGNVHNRRIEPGGAILPHALFIRLLGGAEPLSVFLGGEEAIKAHPLGRRNEHAAWSTEYAGICQRGGEQCHEVRCTLRAISGEQAGQVLEWCSFFLAPGRNYVPVAILCYDPRASKAQAVGEGVVDQWLEVEPGIWFPKHAELRAFEREDLQGGRQVLAWRHVCNVEAVSLQPEHPVSFFQRVTFPKGTFVYEFENGREKRSYRVGSPNDPNMAAGVRGPAWGWLLGAAVGIAGVVCVWRAAVQRMRRKRSGESDRDD
jgi:hypothetical protein